MLDKEGLEYEAVNSGVSGETSSGGDGRIDWVLNQYEPEIFVLELKKCWLRKIMQPI